MATWKPGQIRNSTLRRRTGLKSRGNKYGAKKSASANPRLAGRRFDSKGERERAEQLALLERAGEIAGLEFQVRVQLTEAPVFWRLDYRYQEKGRTVYEDFKGMKSEAFRIKLNLWRVYGPALLRLTERNSAGRIVITQTVMPSQPQGAS